uniref:Uncharacterized protein n=1 Tax=Meloidogyne hapla TaxID=6305 RepID=A0A1I8BPZ0_MELHA
MVSAAVIARAFVVNQKEVSRRAALTVETEENNLSSSSGITLIDHLRVAARASVGGTTRMATIRRAQNEGKRLRPTTTSIQRQDTIGIQKPGLRAMLYGLTLKMEREEKLQKKLTRKREGK